MKTQSQLSLDSRPWSNRFRNELDSDFYVEQGLEILPESKVLLCSRNLQQTLLGDKTTPINPLELSGEALPSQSSPLTTVYAGHQFGGYSPRLGDGRALLLGDLLDIQGNSWELQFKGSGLTPFSRMGDGKAVLRSSIREFLMSEHMHALGIPTTRALSLVGSQEIVYREKAETGALVMRAAASFLRFGHLEYFYHRQEYHQVEKLLQYTLRHDFPQFMGEKDAYFLLLQEICARTARLVAQWMAIGWAHGVLNTDNMSLLGLTLDYGPFGFVEDFDPNFICNHSDHQGRYRLGAQAQIGMWNCNALAWTFSPFLNKDELELALKTYELQFRSQWQIEFSKKLGLNLSSQPKILGDLLKILQNQAVDWTLFWRSYAENPFEPKAYAHLFTKFDEYESWFKHLKSLYPDHFASDENSLRQQLCQINPKYILRNYLAQRVIVSAEKGEFTPLEQLFEVMQNPFNPSPTWEEYTQASPLSERFLQISCSS